MKRKEKIKKDFEYYRKIVNNKLNKIVKDYNENKESKVFLFDYVLIKIFSDEQTVEESVLDFFINNVKLDINCFAIISTVDEIYLEIENNLKRKMKKYIDDGFNFTINRTNRNFNLTLFINKEKESSLEEGENFIEKNKEDYEFRLLYFKYN